MSTRSVRYSTFNRSIRKGNLASTDRDALAFLEAATIYNSNQQKAIIDLVRRLKSAGLWSKMKAIYPFIGGTATTHKWNLKDPRDVDAAFRLTFSGGWTHSANGADPNGTNGYADTYIIPSTNLSQNNTSYSSYLREDDTTNGVIFGATNSSNAHRTFVQVGNGSPLTIYAGINGTPPNDFIERVDSIQKGLFILGRIASNNIYCFQNQIKYDAAVNSTGQPSQKIVYGAYNLNGTIAAYSNQQIAFATIGDGLTDSDVTNLYNIVDLYQKRLGRAV